MIYMILISALVIVITLGFIAATLKWFLPKLHANLFRTHAPIIERAYRAVDLVAHVEYENLSDQMKFRSNYDPSIKIIEDKEHKQYIIRELVNEIADKMLTGGLIEIQDRRSLNNPYRNTIVIRAKVYKEVH